MLHTISGPSFGYPSIQYTHSLSGSCEMNSVTYLRVAGITPAAPFVLHHKPCISMDPAVLGDLRSSDDSASRGIYFVNCDSHAAQILNTGEYRGRPPGHHPYWMLDPSDPLLRLSLAQHTNFGILIQSSTLRYQFRNPNITFSGRWALFVQHTTGR